MLYEEIKAARAWDLSPHGRCFINPYNGCSMGCPFCYWLDQKGWENRIQIKTDIGQVLKEELKTWPCDTWIYLGSVCDPFNQLEETYRLSRQCLETVKQYKIPLLITTSGVHPVIMEYADLFKNSSSRVIVVVELARIPQLEAMRNKGIHKGIHHANQLLEKGVEVWATMAPLIPGIIELEPVLKALNQEIPVYVDGLRCEKESIQEGRVMKWIEKDYPDKALEVREILEKQNLEYFYRILEKYNGNSRVRTFPFQIS